MITFILGFLLGLIVMAKWEVVSDVLERGREKLPSREQVGDVLSAVGRFLKRYWYWASGVAVVLILVVYFLATIPTPGPSQIQIGVPFPAQDNCGNTVNVTITDQDVSRGMFTIGLLTPEKDCRITYPLSVPAPQTQK